MLQKQNMCTNRHCNPTASILRASFSGTDAKALLMLMPEAVNRTNMIMNNGQYVGRVVPTRQPSLLVRVDGAANTTDVIMGSHMVDAS